MIWATIWTSHLPQQGGTIRTLSVSLLAVVALAAGLLLNRSRQPAPTPQVEADNGVEDALQLEALRRAGF